MKCVECNVEQVNNYHENPDDTCVCEPCYNEHDYAECADCGYHKKDDEIKSNGNGGYLCTDCHDEYS